MQNCDQNFQTDFQTVSGLMIRLLRLICRQVAELWPDFPDWYPDSLRTHDQTYQNYLQTSWWSMARLSRLISRQSPDSWSDLSDLFADKLMNYGQNCHTYVQTNSRLMIRPSRPMTRSPSLIVRQFPDNKNSFRPFIKWSVFTPHPRRPVVWT